MSTRYQEKMEKARAEFGAEPAPKKKNAVPAPAPAEAPKAKAKARTKMAEEISRLFGK
jgi:hypothetical protein